MAEHDYIDGFVFPIKKIHLDEYRNIAEQVADIWKEHGALAYSEFVGDDMHLEGTRSFVNMLDLADDEIVILGWVTFPSKEVRNTANKQVQLDPRMAKLVAPLVDPSRMVFDTERMVYGGFSTLVKV